MSMSRTRHYDVAIIGSGTTDTDAVRVAWLFVAGPECLPLVSAAA